MTIAFHTLGCKLNFAETSHLQRQFEKAGFDIVDYHQRADIYVINTCTVTAVAEKKCRTVIRQAVTQNPDAVVAVIGCFAQNDAAQIARIPGVDICCLSYLPIRATHPLDGRPLTHRSLTPFSYPIREATAHAPSSRYRTAVTTSAATAPYRLPADAAAVPPLPRRWRWQKR